MQFRTIDRSRTTFNLDDVMIMCIFSQIAVVHYSDEPRIEFRLRDFKDRNSVLRALRALRYGGGNTKTG